MKSFGNITPYKDGQRKKRQVQSMFDNIAPKYDLLNRVLSVGIDQRWRKRLVRKTLESKPGNILDLATGTGDVSILLAKTVRTPITALDLSDEMLAIAKRKTAKLGLDHQIRFIQGDSENLPFDDNSFEAITVAFGVRNFENTQVGLAECYRILTAGGVLSILEFSRPTIAPFKQLYFFYFKYVLPWIGKITSGDKMAYTYLYESSRAFAAGTEFASLLAAVGFKHVSFKPLTFGVCTLYSAEK